MSRVWFMPQFFHGGITIWPANLVCQFNTPNIKTLSLNQCGNVFSITSYQVQIIVKVQPKKKPGIGSGLFQTHCEFSKIYRGYFEILNCRSLIKTNARYKCEGESQRSRRRIFGNILRCPSQLYLVKMLETCVFSPQTVHLRLHLPRFKKNSTSVQGEQVWSLGNSFSTSSSHWSPSTLPPHFRFRQPRGFIFSVNSCLSITDNYQFGRI